MDAEQIRGLKPMLTRYLKQFDECFARRDTRAHLPVYVQGQLSDLSAKSCEPIALHAGVAPRTLQEFLAQHRWDEDSLRNRLLVRESPLPKTGCNIVERCFQRRNGHDG